MKNKLSLLAKLILLVLLVSCEKEELSLNEELQGEALFKVVSPCHLERTSLSQIPHLLKVKSTLDKIDRETQTNGRIAVNSGIASDITVLTDRVSYIQYGDHHTYTFAIKRQAAEDSNMLENLVLYSRQDGSYAEYIVQYKLTKDEKIKLRAGLPPDLSGKVKFIPLGHNGYINTQTMGTTSTGTASGCEEIVEQVWVSSSSGEHHKGNINEWVNCTAERKPSVYITSTIECEDVGGGDSGFPSDSGTPIDGGGDSGSSSGGSGTGDSGGAVKDIGGVVTEPVIEPELPSDDLIGVVEPDEPILIRDIEKDSTLVQNQKANCIYDKLGGGTTMKSLVTEYEDNGGIVNLTYKVGALTSDRNGECDPTDNTFKNIVITLDENYIATARTIQVARTFLHESVHAKIFSYLRQIGGYEHLDKDNFPVMYEAYVEAKKSGVSMDIVANRVHHEEIAKHYVELIAKGLQEFDTMNHNNPEVTMEHYRALAWQGLEKSTAWENLSTEQQDKINENSALIFAWFSTLSCQD